jgi:hypothetical protein
MIKNVLSELDIKPNKDSLEYADKLILTNFGYHRFSKCYKKSKVLKENIVKNNNNNNVNKEESQLAIPEVSSTVKENFSENSLSDNSKSLFNLRQSYFSKSLDDEKNSERLKLRSSKSFDKDSDYVSDAGSCISGEKTLDRNLMNDLMTELTRMRPYLSNIILQY